MRNSKFLAVDSLKSLAFSILRLLGDGEFRSGEEMARQLGMSRASVWQALRSLDEAGVEVFRVPGRGYRLRDPIEWLDRQAILASLGEKAGSFDLEILDQADSTNRVLLNKAALGAPHRSCVAAELQSAGRGRRGRQWMGRLGGGLAFSLLWRFEQGAASLSGLSLAVGVALLRALNEIGIAGVALKWPNDVQYQTRKLAGILIEMQGDVSGPCAVVIGVGLNLRLGDALLGQIDQPATDLYSIIRRNPPRSDLFAALLRNLDDVLGEFAWSGFSALRDEWQRHHAYHDQPVSLLMPDGSRCPGIVRGVAEDGALLLETEQGLARYISGEVSLRGVP